jgi:hypothetical protein
MKEQFKQMVKTKNYQLEWFYKYYFQKSKVNMNIHMFQQLFEQLNLNEVIDHIAREYGLTRLLSDKNVLIAVYEP